MREVGRLQLADFFGWVFEAQNNPIIRTDIQIPQQCPKFKNQQHNNNDDDVTILLAASVNQQQSKQQP